MLTELTIRDFAIIDRLHLELASGMTVLTGETGAGKSIILDALKLATGERADTMMIRHGADRAEVVARFDLGADGPVARLLVDMGLDADGELLLRRVVTADGRSRAYVNDTPCAVGRLKEIGDHLLEIHGQHEHYRLLQAQAQVEAVDAAGGHGQQLKTLAQAFVDWRQARDRLAALRSEATLSPAEQDLMRFQVEELEPWVAQATDIETLHERHRRLASARELIETCNSAVQTLSDENGERLADVLQQLRRAADIDADLGEARDLIDSAMIQVEEAVQSLNRYLRDLEEEGDDSLSTLENTLSRIHELARKHRVEPEALADRLAELVERLQRAESAESTELKLDRELKAAEQGYVAAADRVHQLRRQSGDRLAARVTELMHQLGMAGGRFEVAVDCDPEAPFTAHGRDRVEFRVTTNAGQPPRPMARVASGGELSRIGLAIKVALADDQAAGTMVFDEVDSGVGGAVAEIVGARLRSLAGPARQVFCVTHLPQVASCAHHHLRVEKRADGEHTVTAVRMLADRQRVEEVARMLGGREITDRTLAHAEEMLESAAAQ